MSLLHSAAPILLYERLQHEGEYSRADQVLSLTLIRILGKLEKDSGNWLLVHEVLAIYQSAAHQQIKAMKLLTTFIAINPNNVNALSALANLEILTADFVGARTHIDKAYHQAPSSAVVYISEFLYQLYQGLVAINKMAGKVDTVTFPISKTFFRQAARENPGLETPLMLQHALKVLQVFYTVIIDNKDRFKKRTAFTFDLRASQKKELSQSKQYLKHALEQESISLYFGKFFFL